MKFKWTNHGRYFEIALSNFEIVEALKKKNSEVTEEIKNEPEPTSDNDLINIVKIRKELCRSSLIVIIFSALTLEAYINDYGIEKCSKNYFTKYLDKLSLLSKWVVVPKIATGREIIKDSKAFEDLSWLVKLRNKLVHYKSKEVDTKKGGSLKDDGFVSCYEAERAIDTVKSVLGELKVIDPNNEMDWLELRENSLVVCGESDKK